MLNITVALEQLCCQIRYWVAGVEYFLNAITKITIIMLNKNREIKNGNLIKKYRKVLSIYQTYVPKN